MSSLLCGSQADLEGSILSWQEMEWSLTGASVTPLEVEREEVCSQSGAHLILLPALLSYQEARSACSKLGEAALGGPRDPASLGNLTSWYGRSVLSCSSVWTPYSDQLQEGLFINENTGDIMRQLSSLTGSPLLLLFVSELDWDVGQPNGGETQNFVSFKVTGEGEKSFLGDEIENIKQCAYCFVPGNDYTSYYLSFK